MQTGSLGSPSSIVASQRRQEVVRGLTSGVPRGAAQGLVWRTIVCNTCDLALHSLVSHLHRHGWPVVAQGTVSFYRGTI
jgi:hypothetical protein